MCADNVEEICDSWGCDFIEFAFRLDTLEALFSGFISSATFWSAKSLFSGTPTFYPFRKTTVHCPSFIKAFIFFIPSGKGNFIKDSLASWYAWSAQNSLNQHFPLMPLVQGYFLHTFWLVWTLHPFFPGTLPNRKSEFNAPFRGASTSSAATTDLLVFLPNSFLHTSQIHNPATM